MYYKKEIRKIYLQRRKEISKKELLLLSSKIYNNIQNINIWNKKYYHIYLPIKYEINTYPIIYKLLSMDKQVVIPKINFSNMFIENYLFKKNTFLKKNKYGILEPLKSEQISYLLIDIVFIPLLIFDKEYNRVGYGYGFYDKFLINCRVDVIKIGLSLLEPISRIIDINMDDIPLDIVVTPNKIYNKII
ncbi:MAG: 5-formyltetrahydrofolate cyclo-ligase [Candidatus Bostrichicola ureolyticus]|nr:MAG: 5-formyltetrahydrofolate cyclo-ligase [Candidatus Bostrichicola ureolyticus]